MFYTCRPAALTVPTPVPIPGRAFLCLPTFHLSPAAALVNSKCRRERTSPPTCSAICWPCLPKALLVLLACSTLCPHPTPPHSWSKVANVLYVDSPAGVGMSYSETPADYHTNDTHTAADLNTFLRRWFNKFEEFQGNDFYVSGVCSVCVLGGAGGYGLQAPCAARGLEGLERLDISVGRGEVGPLLWFGRQKTRESVLWGEGAALRQHSSGNCSQMPGSLFGNALARSRSVYR